jgi:hypothetical protein
MTYTVPAGSRLESFLAPAAGVMPHDRSLHRPPPHPSPLPLGGGEGGQRPGVGAEEPSCAFLLSAPMPVVEREESHARTELGAAQKDTARDLGAKLSSLKGIVWVGVGLFVFGLGSLVWPSLKVMIGSVTTSAALMLGGVPSTLEEVTPRFRCVGSPVPPMACPRTGQPARSSTRNASPR